MTRRAHLEDGKWVHDETMEAYVVRTLAENQARVDILPQGWISCLAPTNHLNIS